MAEPLTPFEEQALQAKAKVRAEMPDVADVPVEPMGWVDRLLAAAKEKIVGGGGQVAAMAKPGGLIGDVLLNNQSGSVAYSPEILAQMSPGSREDTMAHELKHAQQNREDYAGKGLFGRIQQFVQDARESRLPYGQQPRELEAYQFEGDRAAREGRVADPRPKFLSEGLQTRGSISLPEPKLDLIPGDNPSVLSQNVQTLMKMGYSQADATKRAIRESRKSPPGR